MFFLILILWVGISEQRLPEVRPEVTSTLAQVTETSAQLERTEWSPTTVKILEKSIQTQRDVTTHHKLNEPEVTVEPVVMTEAIIMSKPEVTPSDMTKLTGVSIRGPRPEVTVEPVVMTEAAIMSKPEVTPSDMTKLSGVSIRGARPDYNEDGTVNTFGQYLDYGDIGIKVRDTAGSKGGRFRKIVEAKCKEEIKYGNVDSENPTKWMEWSACNPKCELGAIPKRKRFLCKLNGKNTSEKENCPPATYKHCETPRGYSLRLENFNHGRLFLLDHSENRNGKGGTICRGIRDARLKISDKNFLCRQLGFDRHMHEDELEGQDFQTNWQNAGILMYPPVFINGMADSYQYDQYLFADRRNETNQINLRLTENVGRSGCHGHRTDLSLHCFTRYSHRSGHWTAWTSWSDCDPYDTSDEYSKHRGPQYQSRVRVCSTQVGLKSKLYIAECEGGNDFSGFVLDLFQKVYCKI